MLGAIPGGHALAIEVFISTSQGCIEGCGLQQHHLKVLVVVAGNEEVAERSLRNLETVQIVRNSELNAYDVLCNDVIVFSQASLPGANKGDTK